MKTLKTRLLEISLSLWLVLSVITAYNRSFWGDELIRLNQSKLPLTQALRSLFSEPSPFNPAELVLNWLSRIAFSQALPPEIWGRLPGIAWGFLTLLVLGRLAERRRTPWLVMLGMFSVSMTTLSVLMRPYGSLIFAGALAVDRLDAALESGAPVRRRNWDRVLLVLGLGLSHIYGVCYLVLSSLLLRRWIEALLGALWVGLILSRYQIHSGQGGAAELQVFEIIRSTIGSLTNPHKVAPIALFFLLLGSIAFLRSRPKACIAIGAVIGIAIAGPILTTLASGYFFVPRQVAGAQAGVWYLCAMGLDTLASTRFKKLIWPIAAIISVVPWCLSVVFRLPHYPDQPLHRFKHLAQQSRRDPVRFSLFTDYWNSDCMLHYLERVWGELPDPTNVVADNGNKMQRRCFNKSSCIDFLSEPDARPETALYDRVYYSAPLPSPPPNDPTEKWVRTW